VWNCNFDSKFAQGSEWKQNALKSKMIAFHWPMIRRIGSDDETGRFLSLYLFSFSPEWVRRQKIIKTESWMSWIVVIRWHHWRWFHIAPNYFHNLCQFSFCYLVVVAKNHV
jgi:hypothetical protein